MLLGEERREFGRYLRQLRQRKNLTLRELAQKSTVPFPNISAIECGRLGAGRMVATKLAVGLGLRGRERKNFVTFAAYTNSRDRLAKEYLAYPAVLANLLSGMLRELGVRANDIIGTFWVDSEILHHPEPHSVGVAKHFKSKPELEQYLDKKPHNATVVVAILKSGRQIAICCESRIF